ncbi:MAG: HIT family protein [Bacilli bacterium]|nr:HIT family protein [Bacilli bacterium]
MNCVFCNIIKGNIPAYSIYEDEIVKVILDVQPNTNGHMLIIPKEHVVDINDIKIEVLTHINMVIKKMHPLLEQALAINGMTIVQNNGSAQEVKHFHMHLIPRYHDDGLTPKYSSDNLLPLDVVYTKLTKK